MNETPDKPDLIALATLPDHNAVRRFGNACSGLGPTDVVRAYEALRASAPQRHRFDRRYFVGHDGRPSSGAYTHRIEEHLAIALVNDKPNWSMPEGGSIELLDYQVPLKARRSDAGVGKIDIFGLTDGAIPVVIELTVLGKGTPDTPLRALLEGLAYAAIVEANESAFRSEISGIARRTTTSGRPDLLIVAPSDYWCYWSSKSAAGDWESACSDLTAEIAQKLSMDIAQVSIGAPDLKLGLEGQRPRITNTLDLETIGLWTGRPGSYPPEK